MKQNQIWLYGAGGHALVVADVLIAMGQTVRGIFDDDPALSGTREHPILPGLEIGGREQFESLDGLLLISVGNNRTRQQLAGDFPVEFTSAIHPSAQISPSATIGVGSVVFHGAIVQANVRVGRHVIINTAACVDHDCQVGDFAHIAPNVTLCGDVTIGEGALIGAGAVVIPGLRIGAWSIVGAGSVVVRDVPDQATVVGNPAREMQRARNQ